MNNFIKRTLTGLIFVGVLVSAILFSAYTFAILFGLITALSLWEFYGLLDHYQNAALKRAVSTAGGVYFFAACFLNASGVAGGIVFLPYILFIMYTFIGELYTKAPNPINNWAFTFLAQIYCAGSFSLMNYLVLRPGDALADSSGPQYAPWLILAIFIFVWLNDTGAFLVGSMLGKHKLFERISPKKSWDRIIDEEDVRSERLRQYLARSWRNARPLRQRVDGISCCLHLYRMAYSKLNVSVTMREVALESASEYFIVSCP